MSFPRPDRAAWLFSANCLAAALLALLIGFWLDLPRPYWAVMTVYIISQPLSGAVRSKAVFRVFGTLLGAGFAVLVVPPLIDSPPLLCLALALWLGSCLFISLLDRTPRAYVVMLAGYTATLIAFPIVDHPELVFDVAVSRVEEIILGILCATLTHSLLFPRPVGSVLCHRLTDWLGEADGWALDLLGHVSERKAVADRRHLAAAANEIRQLALLLPFDSSPLRHAGAVVRAIEHRLMLLIPILSGVSDRITALGPDAAPLDGLLTEIAAWIISGAQQDAAAPLVAAIEQARSQQIGGDWPSLLRQSLLARLQDLCQLLREAHQLLHHIRDGASLDESLRHSLTGPAARPMHRDYGMAAMSGLSASLSVLLVCVVWIVMGWPEGGIAAALAGVFCALFAALDDPAPAIVGFGLFSFLSLPVACLYQFAVLPAIDGFLPLAVVLSPVLLIGGAFMVDRRSALPALAFQISLASALALQENFSADFAGFVNGNSAQFVALFIALLVTRGLRSISVETAISRLLTRSWKVLAGLAQQEHEVDIADLVSHMIDRIGLLTARLSASGDDALKALDALSELRIAMNLALLQGLRRALNDEQNNRIAALLAAIGRHFAGRAAGKVASPESDLLPALDASLASLTTAPVDDLAGIAALVGLRRNLCPAAPPFIAPSEMLS